MKPVHKSSDATEAVLRLNEEKDLEGRLIHLTTLIRDMRVACPDCRMLRNAVLVLIEIMVPDLKPESSMAVVPPSPLTVTAHSEVIVKETIERAETKDGTSVSQETSTKVV